VVRQLLVVLMEAIRIELLDGAAHGLVELLATLDEKAVVRHVLDDRVLEDVRRLGQESLLIDDLERFQLAQQTIELTGEPGDALQQALEELATDDRRELHRALAVLAQAVQAGHDDALDGVRDADGDALHHLIAIALAAQDAEIEERLRDLLDEERHALRLVEERRAKLGREAGGPEHAPRHLDCLGLGALTGGRSAW
jgi:hypothetical protein